MAASVQSIYQYWKQFDLPTLQKELDDVATEVANRQDESENSRKKLVDLSRDFKKNTPEDVRKIVTPLLKSFQAEVDGLCKRSKAAEAAFLTLYKRIVETPDPTQALENAAQWQKKCQRLQDLEIENANLKDTLKEYTSEFAEVKNQEVTIRQLKAEVKQYEDQLESTVETKLAEKEVSLKRAFDEREKELLEHSNLISAKVEEAEHRANALQASLNAAQHELFVLRSHSDEVGSAKSSEMDMLLSDVEKANLRAACAERECELLKEKISIVENPSKTVENEDGFSQQRFEQELKLKEKQISQLLDEVTQVNSKAIKDKADYEAKVEEMAKQLMQKKQLLQGLEEKVESASDYDEIKRELAILKSIYLGGDEPEDEEPLADSKSLESLLLEKNKTLQMEKSTLNTKKRELENRVRQNSFALDSPNARLSKFSPKFQKIKNRSTDTNALNNGTNNNNGNNNNSEQSSTSSSSNQLTPLRSVVERMACLIGTELVNQYQESTECSIKKELDVAQSSSTENPQSDDGQFINSTLDDATMALIREKLDKKDKEALAKSSRNGSHSNQANLHKNFVISGNGNFTNVDEALNCGIRREIIECIAIQHLQKTLALRMSKMKATLALDTIEIARHCRQILNTYNIGQRLLAKCVLNQSQGAVSELLAKPRVWEKLTEKGKESFRRLYAWLSDEPSISVLKMISPKRAYGGFRERYPAKPEDQETQDKITAILSAAKEAQRRVQKQTVASKLKVVPLNNEPLTVNTDSLSNSPNDASTSALPSNDPTSAAVTVPSTPSPVGSSFSGTSFGDFSDKMQNAANAMKNRSSGRYRHDDIPKEMIFEIYKRELAKLRDNETCLRSNSSHSPALKSPKIESESMDSSTFNAKLVIDEPPPLKMPKLSSSAIREIKNEILLSSASSTAKTQHTLAAEPILPHKSRRKSSHVVRVIQQQTTDSASKVCSTSSTVSPKVEESVSSANASNAKKRLSNSGCFSRPRNHSLSPDSKRQSKNISSSAVSSKKIDTIGSVLSLCVQQAASENMSVGGNSSDCSTSAGTKAFKAILAPISQDQFESFGEINTEDLVREVKDYLTQFSISQRLFGEQVLGLSQGSVSDLLARPKPWNMLTQKGREPFIRMKMFMDDKEALSKLLSRRSRETQNGEHSNQDSNDHDFSAIESPALSFTTDNQDNFSNLDHKTSFSDKISEISDEHVLAKPSMNFIKTQQTAPTVVNNTIIALEQIKKLQKELDELEIQLDTQSLVRQVKDDLLNHNIGQKVFGQAVLGMSQGAVSDLLAKSKGWPQLSVKGKEAFMRMHLWLQDPMKIEKVFEFRANRGELSQLQHECKTLSATAEQQKSLIISLEEDLMRIQNFQRPETEGASAPDETFTDVISNAVGNIHQVNLPRTSPSANADSLLPIVVNQRERFRVRVQEVEEQNLQLQQHIALLTGEIDRMRNDNVKLYEKIKFLQTYRGNQPTSVSAVDETVNRYSTQYEATLDPFQRFGVQERQRRYMALSTHDKATLSISRLIVSNGTARAIFFFYLIFLHCLVFLVLYKLAYTESCKRDFSTDCVEKYREHMQLVHGKDVHG